MVGQKQPEQTLTVTDNRTGKTYQIPIEHNSIPATAFKKCVAPGGRAEDDPGAGLRVYDPGFMNTAVIQSTITYIDGDKGILRYRGYPIEQLAEKSTFLESAYLLLYGELPTKRQFNIFEREILHHTYVHRDIDEVVGAFLAILTAGFASLGAFAPEANPSLQGQKLYTTGTTASLANMDKQIFRLIGKSITLAAMAFRIRQGRPFNQPPEGMDYTSTFLYLLDHLNERDFKPNPVLAKALDVLFLLHADHELNASAATALQVGSTLVDPYSAVAAATSSLYGPLHGGANEAVIRMLIAIGSPENVPSYLEKVKRKEVVLSGFGHRVYRTSDPRSKIIKQTAEEVFKVTGRDPLLDTAIALHDAAIKDDYFVSRRLYPNVDFWSGLIYRAMGFPTDFFPVLFAVPRVVGWLSHWRQQMLQKGGVKIWRPRQIYLGEGERPFVPIEQRKEGGGPEPTPVEHTFSKRNFLSKESATGNLGLRLIPALLVHKHTLTIYVRSPSKLRSLVPESLLSQCAIVVGDAVDSVAVKRAIIENDCDAVVDTAGNQVVPWSKSEDFQLQKLAASISRAAREAGKERGRPIRAWFIGGLGLLQIPGAGYLVQDLMPKWSTIQHQGTADVLKRIPTDELAWSLLCVAIMRPRSKTIAPIPQRQAHGFVVQKQVAAGYVFHWITHVPFVGAFLNLCWEMVNYTTKLEDVADLIAEDLALGDRQAILIEMELLPLSTLLGVGPSSSVVLQEVEMPEQLDGDEGEKENYPERVDYSGAIKALEELGVINGIDLLFAPHIPPHPKLPPSLLSSLKTIVTSHLTAPSNLGSHLLASRPPTTARDRPQTHLTTTHPELDELLSGGIRVGHVVELAGPRGSYKTLMALYATLSDLLLYPTHRALIIDTRNVFDAARSLGILRYLRSNFAKRGIVFRSASSTQEDTKEGEVGSEVELEVLDRLGVVKIVSGRSGEAIDAITAGMESGEEGEFKVVVVDEVDGLLGDVAQGAAREP
ncbi:citrate synthase [Pseudohyphozyma bogoriensis]|nr:citrate synthase [Pseudohyphozyma bogoriensis]